MIRLRMTSSESHPTREPMTSVAKSVPEDSGAVPLCVDLDGTLVKTDCLWEMALRALFHDFRKLATVGAGAWRGRAWLKHELCRCASIPAHTLPFNANVIALIKREKALGRRIVLVTASDQSIADAVAEHLKLFDEVIGSDGVTNLKGPAKAALLVEKFGRGGFDYVGDSPVDMPVWNAARAAYAVRPSFGLKAKLASRGNTTIVGEAHGLLRPLVQALRPKHWVKNILVFLPLMTAHAWRQTDIWMRLGLVFCALCFAASTIYLVNDLADLESDRRHKDKWRRPIASGALSIPMAIAAVPFCLAVTLACAASLGVGAVGLVAGYIAATVAYSFGLKTIPVLDILLLSGFYVYRIVAGAVLAPLPLSPWLIAFAMFLFVSLAAAKRYVELTSVADGGQVNLRRGYRREDYPMIAAFGANGACLAVLVLGLYVNSDTFRALYSGAQAFWLLCPLLLYWLMRIWLLAGRGQLHEDPVIFALKDRVTWIVAALGGVVFYIAMTGRL